jgi:hypothetical protein
MQPVNTGRVPAVVHIAVAKKALNFVLKVVLLILLVRYLALEIHTVWTHNNLVPLLLLVLCLALLKRWFPPLYGFMKRIAVRTIKAVAGWLWRKPEKKGGAHVRQPRMRWKP